LKEAALNALDGRLIENADLVPRIVALGEEMGSPLRGYVAAYSVCARPLFWLGRIEEARELRRKAGTGNDSLLLAWTALYDGYEGKSESAQTALSQGVEHVRDSDRAPTLFIGILLEAAVALADRAAAARLAPLLDGAPAASIPLTPVIRLVAEANLMNGDHEGARKHFEEALAWAHSLRCRPEIALTRLGMAELLLDEAGDQSLGEKERRSARDEAQAHLDFAIEEFRVMQMQPSIERALRHKGLLHA
jgi:tetratricopeptide (TPR) repeat protein